MLKTTHQVPRRNVNTIPIKHRRKKDNLTAQPAPSQSSLEIIKEIEERSAQRRRKTRTRSVLKLISFVLLPVIANAAVYYASSSGYTEVTTLLQIQSPKSAPAQNGNFFSSLTPTAISEAVAAQETVRSSAVMERLLQGTDDGSIWLSIPTLPALSNFLLSNEKIRLSRYRSLVKAGYDPTEQVIRISVRSYAPGTAQQLSGQIVDIIRETMNKGAQSTRQQLLNEARMALQNAQADYTSTVENVRQLENQVGVVDPTIETEFLYRMIGNLREDRLEYEVQLQSLAEVSERRSAVTEDLKQKIEILDSSIAELRAEMTASETELSAISNARLLLDAAHFEKDLARQRLTDMSTRFAEAELQSLQRQHFVTVAAPPNEVSISRSWASLTLFATSLAIGLIIYLFMSITNDALRREY